MAQQQAVHKFVLGNKELEGKVAEFQYDKGWYSITDIVGEERNVIYKSRNAQEAYMKWNVYIGRKKERPDDRRKANQEKNELGNRPQRENHETRDRSENENNGRHDNYRRRRRDNRRDRQVQEQE